MPIIDAGLFIIISAIAFVFLFVKGYSALKVISIIGFFGLGVVLIAGYDIVYTATSTTGSSTTEEQRFLIDENSDWLGWFYMALGTVAVAMFFKEVMA